MLQGLSDAEQPAETLITLYRPIGRAELDLIAEDRLHHLPRGDIRSLCPNRAADVAPLPHVGTYANTTTPGVAARHPEGSCRLSTDCEIALDTKDPGGRGPEPDTPRVGAGRGVRDRSGSSRVSARRSPSTSRVLDGTDPEADQPSMNRPRRDRDPRLSRGEHRASLDVQ